MPILLPFVFVFCEQIIAAATDVQEKKEIYAPYNILPLDSAGATQSIMQLEEVKAAVGALWNTRGLNWPTEFERHRQKAGDLDLLDWLRAMFGFQACGVCMKDEMLIIYSLYEHEEMILLAFCFNLVIAERQCQEPEGAFDFVTCQ